MAVRLAMLFSAGAPVDHPDTPSYRSGVSFIGENVRPWPVPLALDVFGDRGFTVFQTVLSAVAFCVLAWAIAGQMQTRAVRIATVVGVLALGCADHVVAWDPRLTSESLAISLTALLIAAFVRLERAPWWLVVPLFAVWVFVRDGHLYLGVLVLACVTVWGWRRRQWIIPVGFAVVLVWAGLAAQNDDYIETYNIVANIAVRGDIDPDAREWFHAHGMPDSDAFTTEGRAQLVGALLDDPEFVEWAQSDGLALYARYLVAHPGYAARGWLHIFEDRFLGGNSMVDFSYSSPDSPDPVSLDVVWPHEASWYTLLVVGVGGLWSLLLARRGRVDSRWWLPGLMAASTLPHGMMAYHGSPFEIARHGVVLAFVLVFAGWWVVALCADVQLDIDDSEPVAVAGGDVGASAVDEEAAGAVEVGRVLQ